MQRRHPGQVQPAHFMRARSRLPAASRNDCVAWTRGSVTRTRRRSQLREGGNPAGESASPHDPHHRKRLEAGSSSRIRRAPEATATTTARAARAEEARERRTGEEPRQPHVPDHVGSAETAKSTAAIPAAATMGTFQRPPSRAAQPTGAAESGSASSRGGDRPDDKGHARDTPTWGASATMRSHHEQRRDPTHRAPPCRREDSGDAHDGHKARQIHEQTHPGGGAGWIRGVAKIDIRRADSTGYLVTASARDRSASERRRGRPEPAGHRETATINAAASARWIAIGAGLEAA